MLFIQEAVIPQPNDLLTNILFGFIWILILVISFFLRSLYADFKVLKSQVYVNKEGIAENKTKDDARDREFVIYKETIRDKDDSFQLTLDKVDLSVEKLTIATNKLSHEVTALKAKIK